MAPKPILGYWEIRGLANPIRCLFKYAGQDFENRMYEQGDAPDYSPEKWTKEKYTLGLPFPNLPYLIDDDIKITQSNAILRYLGGKHDLLGETPKVRAETDMMLENGMDFRNNLKNLVYNKDYAKLVDSYFEKVAATFRAFDKFLEGRNWFGGGQKPTICDFPMYELLDQHRLMRPGCLDDYKNLQAFLKRFEELPKIKEYMASSEYIRQPVNNKNAGWR